MRLLGADTINDAAGCSSRARRKEVSGYDVFVIRGGKVVFQTVIINPAPKLMKAN